MIINQHLQCLFPCHFALDGAYPGYLVIDKSLRPVFDLENPADVPNFLKLFFKSFCGIYINSYPKISKLIYAYISPKLPIDSINEIRTARDYCFTGSMAVSKLGDSRMIIGKLR
jgi:hypothetical protein